MVWRHSVRAASEKQGGHESACRYHNCQNTFPEWIGRVVFRFFPRLLKRAETVVKSVLN
jgi:hypothetical protein